MEDLQTRLPPPGTLNRVSLSQYALPLDARPGQARQGLLLQLVQRDGREILSEIAPLPGFSPDSLPAVKRTTLRWLERLWEWSRGEEVSTRKSHGGFPDLTAFPSLAFGLDCALSALQEGAPAGSKSIRINALITGDPREWPRRANDFLGKGFQTIKIKIGRQKRTLEHRALRSIAELCGEGVAIRLDANRTFSLADGLSYFQTLPDLPLEYIEEPLRNPDELNTLGRTLGLPLALDESLDHFLDREGRIRPPAATRAIILKPMLRGLRSNTIALIRLAQARELQAVITSSLESEIGLYHLAELCANECPEVACGLGTRGIFAAGLLPHDPSWELPLWWPRPMSALRDLESRYLTELHVWE